MWLLASFSSFPNWASPLGCFITWQLTYPSTREAQTEEKESGKGRSIDGRGKEKRREERGEATVFLYPNLRNDITSLLLYSIEVSR